MSRYIDADELLSDKFKNPISYNAFANLVKRQNAIDIVRCAECKYRLTLQPTEHYEKTYVCSRDHIWGSRKAFYDDWYCADGERRDDENT